MGINTLLKRSSCLLVFLLVATTTSHARRLTAALSKEDKLIGWRGETYNPPARAEGIALLQSGSIQELLKQHDRRVEVLSWEPRAFLYHNFLTPQECDHLVKLAEPSVSRSAVIDPSTGANMMDSIRTSFGGVLSRGQDAVVTAIENRIAEWTQLPPSHGEAMQVLRYTNGQKYDAHYDWFGDSKTKFEAPDGNRVATVLMYLSDVEEGGETTLPLAEPLNPHILNQSGLTECARKMGIAVKPMKGSALLFWDLKTDSETGERASLHSSCPIVKGIKWIATKWIHNKPHAGDYDPLRFGLACTNSRPECPQWAKDGLCSIDPTMVGSLGKCRRTCGDCVSCNPEDVLCLRRNLLGRQTKGPRMF